MSIKYYLLFLVCLAYSNLSQAQVIDENAGKTYYYHDEASRKKVKEIFHHKQIIKIMPDPNNHGSYIDTFMYVKNGPYTSYDEDGNLICTGYYIQEKKDSIWKFYDKKGNLLKTERYHLGVKVK
jgi:hypothetical protein